ncbi:MAG: hypothetical protein V4671_31070 [Armatimonadota bacterium]
MIRIKIRDAARSSIVLLALPLLLTGCRGASFVEGGPEIRYLTSAPPVERMAGTKGKPLLPLTVGSRWEMRQIGIPPQKAAIIEARVVKRDGNGSLMEIRKNGQLWRRETYRDTASGLFLTAMGEDDKPLMQLSPPVPITLYPAVEGNGEAWNGTFRYAETIYPANGYSRISALEAVSGPTGRKFAYRTDTLVAINQNGSIVKFPTLRWLTPGIGFVRRSFVEQGRPMYAELRKFTPG